MLYNETRQMLEVLDTRDSDIDGLEPHTLWFPKKQTLQSSRNAVYQLYSSLHGPEAACVCRSALVSIVQSMFCGSFRLVRTTSREESGVW